MDHFKRFKQQLSTHTFFAVFTPGALGIGTYIGLREYMEVDFLWAAIGSGAVLGVSILVAHVSLLSVSLKPIEMMWQAIWHVSPHKSDVPPPQLDRIRTGHELVSALVMQVYDLASSKPVGPMTETAAPSGLQPVVADNNSLLESIPLSLFVLDKDWNIRATNTVACNYIGLSRENVSGRSIYDVLHMSFQSDDTLENWLKTIGETRATDTRTWEHARLNMPDGTIKQFDLAASYSKDNSSGNEVVLALFDRSKAYSTQDQATSYVAMAVHELRTPLTMLRGYIEMFEDELGPNLSVEHREFMRKMSASAQSLTAFVANILNVARIDENQFTLSLHEADWGEVLKEIAEDMELRATVRNKKLTVEIADQLPTVAIDKISMHEVVGNLVDNAIKYSGQSNDITIKAFVDKEGQVATEVIDNGVGIPESVLGNLFTKFYRSHRSKNAVGGNGLGLYLVKSIVTAHGGTVWVHSKEGEGSRFGFSLQPYANISKDKVEGQDGIERQASGWIKNHSLYRR